MLSVSNTLVSILGWNSADAVRVTERFLTLAGIACFGFMAILEWIGHHTQREDLKHRCATYTVRLFVVAVAMELTAFIWDTRKDFLYDQERTNSQATARSITLSTSSKKRMSANWQIRVARLMN
jgi:hypothetical protein